MGETNVFNNKSRTSCSIIRNVLLLILFLHHIYALKGVMNPKMTELSEEMRRKLHVHKEMGLRFLTIWNFIGQMMYMITELTLAVLPRTKLTQSLDKLNWLHFMSMVWPTSVFISLFFWSMFIVDRELILPKHADVVLPLHLNHSVHTVILLLNVLEFFTSQREDIPPTRLMRLINLLYMLTYAFVLNFTFLWNGVWIYPFLKLVTWSQRFVVYAVVSLVTQLLLQVGFSLQSYACNKHKLKYKFN